MNNNIEKLLQELHHGTAEYFTDTLQRAREEGESLPPSFMSALIKFLKDNDITCEIAEGTAVSDLTAEITEQDTEFLQLVS
jgi:hypothetical protein